MSSPRRATLARARQSRRPSRLGSPAGAAGGPDFVLDADAGFPGLLKRVWREAAAAPDLGASVRTLLTLGGHVPEDIQVRALRLAEEAALTALCGSDRRAPATEGQPAFSGELALTTSGRVAVRVPSQPPLVTRGDLVDTPLRVPWTVRMLSDYHREFSRASVRASRAVADCRQWLAAVGPRGREDMLATLTDAALRTAPFVLYQEDRQYTNFRDRNTLTGKTLWPGHPDCALSALRGLPVELWSDGDAVLVVCLTLLTKSAGYARIEEANGTQVTVEHVAQLLERTRREYNRAYPGRDLPPAASTRVGDLADLARRLRERRAKLAGDVQLYREIHGVLMHKVERAAGPCAGLARQREQELCADLRERLPVTGGSLEELGASIAEAPGCLSAPHGDFGTGLESVVYETVRAATRIFEADFAMSRGIRSLPRLIQALRAGDWAEITRWELPEYFCCVVPSPDAHRHFGGSASRLADMAWAISSRMQYNSWHFIAGNLPMEPVVVARDYFVPPTIPDLSYYSDQHHRGHVAARVRFSIRSPQAVEVLARRFNGFVDLRLLRCEGNPFNEQDLLAAQRCSGFIARTTSLAAALAAGGADFEITAFDSQWHWTTIQEASGQGR